MNIVAPANPANRWLSNDDNTTGEDRLNLLILIVLTVPY